MERTSTSSLESEDSLLPPEKLDSKPLPSVNPMSDAELSLSELGDCPSSRISENLTVGDTQESLFSLEDRHASLPVAPGSREAKEMTAGSGRKLCACLTRADRIASFSRILLESSTWGSTEYFLRWEGSATKRNRSIFRLAPWTRRSCDTESGLSVSWQTPRSDDPGCHNGKQDALPGQMKRTWPTLHGTEKEEYERRQGPTGNELGNLVNRTAATWPTPQSLDEKGETQNAYRMDAVPNVLKASWPTPNASDGSGGAQNPEKRKAGNHSVQLPDYIGKTQYGCLARTENFVVRLTTLSTWLMGYTAAYLARWETRSVRRSRVKS